MNQNFLRKTWVVALMAFVSCFLWGRAIPMIKTGYAWMEIASSDTASQILYAGARFTSAGILTVIFGSILTGKFLVPNRRMMNLAFRLCLAQTVVQYFFFYMGVAHISGGIERLSVYRGRIDFVRRRNCHGWSSERDYGQVSGNTVVSGDGIGRCLHDLGETDQAFGIPTLAALLLVSVGIYVINGQSISSKMQKD